ncbi:hypothetical protein [Parapedobacter sp. 2B3]|uniref:hypothetical protein n=1 Tax=Parapedobacter sp. 2B3 TaxID=3342381 RepID=UPI0035B62FF0
MERCSATGKSIFRSLSDAMERVMDFRKNIQQLRNGRRRKHRQGKPKQKRVYLCEHCNGYHLTSWERYIRKRKQNDAAVRTLIVRRRPR